VNEKTEMVTKTKRTPFEEELKILGITDYEFQSFFELLYRICVYKVIVVIPCLVYPMIAVNKQNDLPDMATYFISKGGNYESKND